MSNPFVFSMNEVYRADIEQLLSARRNARVIHNTGDIDASGDEIEEPFRAFLRRRLPSRYLIGHGHVVDKSLNVSPQFDVVIADNHGTPILFEAENGCQYFPWESVYAVGEIKTTYDKNKKPIEGFADTLNAKLLNRLSREATPSNYLLDGISLGGGFVSSDNRSSRNPLFNFIVFFDSGNATKDSLTSEYSAVSKLAVPLISIFLDGKVVTKGGFKKVEGGFTVDKINTDPIALVEQKDIHWIRLNFLDEQYKGAQALVVLMMALFNHLNQCVLMRPPLSEYLVNVMKSAGHRPDILSIQGQLDSVEMTGVKIPDVFKKFLMEQEANGINGLVDMNEEEFMKFMLRENVDYEELMRDYPVESFGLPNDDNTPQMSAENDSDAR